MSKWATQPKPALAINSWATFLLSAFSLTFSSFIFFLFTLASHSKCFCRKTSFFVLALLSSALQFKQKINNRHDFGERADEMKQ